LLKTLAPPPLTNEPLPIARKALPARLLNVPPFIVTTLPNHVTDPALLSVRESVLAAAPPIAMPPPAPMTVLPAPFIVPASHDRPPLNVAVPEPSIVPPSIVPSVTETVPFTTSVPPVSSSFLPEVIFPLTVWVPALMM
jgi:hypothetical protein